MTLKQRGAESADLKRLTIDDLTREAYWSRRPTIEEQGWLASIADLSPEPFVLNAQLGADNAPTIEPIVVRDIDGWRANRYIGEIRHGGRTLEIRPRLGVETITGWISTILNVQVLPRSAALSGSTSRVVTQLLAALWRASVLTAGQHALPRRKVKISSSDLMVRGRLDVAETARRRASGHRDLASIQVVRSYDNAPARAVVLADRYFDQQLAGNRWRGPWLGERLSILRSHTGARPKLPTLQEIRRTRYSPITAKWQRAAELSWRILQDDPLGVAADDESTHGVLVDVAELWELFVLHCVGLATEHPVRHGTNRNAFGQLARSTVDPSQAMGQLYPDILVGEKPITAILDAKYKRISGRRGVDREDLYQIHAYSTASGAPIAALAYPATKLEMPTVELQSPWRTSVSNLSFLTLPTERDKCVSKLQHWFATMGSGPIPEYD